MTAPNEDQRPLATAEERQKMARDVRAARPHLLVGWRGWSVRGRHVHPYLAFARSHCRRRPKDEQIADLLVGDVFADALLQFDLDVRPLHPEAEGDHDGEPT